jgi:hypothetical protein
MLRLKPHESRPRGKKSLPTLKPETWRFSWNLARFRIFLV